MFFENNNLCFEVLNVFHLKERPATDSINKNRSRSGMAYRISGNSHFHFSEKSLFADTGSIIYTPAGVDYRRISTVENIIIVHLNVYGKQENEIQLLPPEKAEPFFKYFFEMERIWNSNSPGYQHKCTSILYNMLSEMARFEFLHPENKKEELIKKSLLYMNTHFTNSEITIDEIAKQSHVSTVYFRKLYKEIFGCPPAKAISDMRIQRAKEFLQSGYFTVYEVAEKCGFENVKYFSTLFKKVTGVSPSEFGKQSIIR